MKYVWRADGSEAMADDFSPTARALALLIEHANARRASGLPLPCLCPECLRHRSEITVTTSEDGRTLIVRTTGT